MKVGDLVQMKGPDGDIGIIIEIPIDGSTSFVKVLWSNISGYCAASHLTVLKKEISSDIFVSS
jgi:hypothetical protein|tara:strand:- start:172 stop:360 length:189 start_codon:yes stop_codon:yes gene_type:complete